MIFLDSAATTPVRREVLEAMWPYLTQEFGNPSSHHELGERAAAALSDARAVVANALGMRAGDVVFTSGGSEADNLAVKGIALANPRGRRIVTTAIEHEAVLESADYIRRLHGFEVIHVPLTPEGLVTVEALASVLTDDTTLVSIHHGNNEIGVVQPIAELRATARGIPFHTDAVQSAGWLSLHELGVDAITIAGHKLGAPKGTGVLGVRGSIPLEPLIHGGGQERGRRSGTQNVAGAVALATALALGPHPSVAAARDTLIDGVLADVPRALLTGPRQARLPNHASFVFPGTSGEAVLLELDRRGVISSSGSACAAGSNEPSHVLVALGIESAVAQTSVRFSLSPETTEADAGSTVAHVIGAVRALADLAR